MRRSRGRETGRSLWAEKWSCGGPQDCVSLAGGANWKAEEAEGLGERAGMIEMRPKVGRARPSGTS